MNALDPFENLVGVVVRSPMGDVDQAAGIDQVVGCVEDSPAMQFFTIGVLGQLVVGPSGDNPAIQQGNRVSVQDATQGTGRKYI